MLHFLIWYVFHVQNSNQQEITYGIAQENTQHILMSTFQKEGVFHAAAGEQIMG